MNYQDFKKHPDWVKVWSGKWSFHSDMNFGKHWTVLNKIAGKPAYQKVIYVYKDGITDCWVREADKENLGKRLVKAYQNAKNVKILADSLKNMALEIFSFIESHDPKKITQEEYKNFWFLVGRYYLPHLSVKYIVDYFSTNQLKKFLPILEEARLFSEPVFRDIENFMEKIAMSAGKKYGYFKKQILSTTPDELAGCFKTVNLPNKQILSQRYRQSAILFDRGQYEIYSGKEFDKIDMILSSDKNSNIVKGSIAYRGVSMGPVRIILDPKKDGPSFRSGEILVTGMTRPEFLPMMKKAAAFVTDAGGILSHAAIVARELKKPCIIGTHIATRILKTGDLIEVDADKGIIKILKRNLK